MKISSFSEFTSAVINSLSAVIPGCNGVFAEGNNKQLSLYLYLDNADSTHPGDLEYDGRYVVVKETFIEERPYGIAFMEAMKGKDDSYGPIIAGDSFDESIARTIASYLNDGMLPGVAIPEGLQ